MSTLEEVIDDSSLALILSRLSDPADVLRASVVCRRWARVLANDYVGWTTRTADLFAPHFDNDESASPAPGSLASISAATGLSTRDLYRAAYGMFITGGRLVFSNRLCVRVTSSSTKGPVTAVMPRPLAPGRWMLRMSVLTRSFAMAIGVVDDPTSASVRSNEDPENCKEWSGYYHGGATLNVINKGNRACRVGAGFTDTEATLFRNDVAVIIDVAKEGMAPGCIVAVFDKGEVVRMVGPEMAQLQGMVWPALWLYRAGDSVDWYPPERLHGDSVEWNGVKHSLTAVA